MKLGGKNYHGNMVGNNPGDLGEIRIFLFFLRIILGFRALA